jgi:hypothetical protein
MSIMSNADRLRLARIERGLRALDDEQAEYRERLERAGLLTEPTSVAGLPSLTPAQLAVLRRVPSAPAWWIPLGSAFESERQIADHLVRSGNAVVATRACVFKGYQRTPLGDAVVSQSVQEQER